MSALGRLLRLAALVGAEVAAVVELRELGTRAPFAIPRHHVDAWLRTTPPADALVAGLRVVALVGAGWLLLTTTAYVIARMSRWPGAVRATQWATLPVVRRAVDAALAASVAAGTILAPSAAHAADVRPPATTTSIPTAGAAGVTVRSGHTGNLASLPPEPAPPTRAARPKSPAAKAPAPPASIAPIGPIAPIAPTASEIGGSTTIVVEPGDNLWDLAATRLASATGRTRADVPDDEIARYWAAVCDGNRARLASGDPSVIYPGELVTLPPVR